MSDAHSNRGRRGAVAGIADLQALAVTAVTALESAGLADEVRALHARVLSRAPEELLEQVEVGDRMTWVFAPMVELLMHELGYLATAPDLPLEVRRERIRWALDMAGF